MRNLRYYSSRTDKNKDGEFWAASCSPEDVREENGAHIRKGRRLVRSDDGRFEWEEGSYSVYDRFRRVWRRKIDFALDELGAETVTREIRSIAPGTLSDLFKTTGWIKSYRNKLDSLVQLALTRGKHE